MRENKEHVNIDDEYLIQCSRLAKDLIDEPHPVFEDGTIDGTPMQAGVSMLGLIEGISLLKKQRDLLAEECSEMDESISWERGNGKDFKSKEEWLHWSESKAREAENG